MDNIKLGPRGLPATVADLQACVGPGWGAIIERLVNDLFALGWGGTVLQVKEKFGGLCFYIGSASEAVFKRIDSAEAESYKTCEECGEPGALRGGGWLRTLCDEHAGGKRPFSVKEDIP